MKYYRVKQEYDNVYYSTGFDFLIGGQLFTESEYYTAAQHFLHKCRYRKGATEQFSKMFDIVYFNKNDTYFFFGARFGE